MKKKYNWKSNIDIRLLIALIIMSLFVGYIGGYWDKIAITDNINSKCHTLIYKYDYPNNTFYFVHKSYYVIDITGYSEDIYRIGENTYKFELECE